MLCSHFRFRKTTEARRNEARTAKKHEDGGRTHLQQTIHITIFNLPTKNILSFTNHAQRQRANCGRCEQISWTKIENDSSSPNLFHLNGRNAHMTSKKHFKEWEVLNYCSLGNYSTTREIFLTWIVRFVAGLRKVHGNRLMGSGWSRG